MERVRRDQSIKDQGAAGVCLCGTCGMEEEEKENRRTGTARGAATDGGFARCRGYGRRNDRRGGEWRTRHAAPGTKTNLKTEACKGSDGVEGVPLSFDGTRGRRNGRGARARRGPGNQGTAGVVPVWTCGAEEDEDGRGVSGTVDARDAQRAVRAFHSSDRLPNWAISMGRGAPLDGAWLVIEI